MVNYRYLGYGTTNSNGVATLDYDENGDAIDGYTGTGIGEVDIVASLDNPITSSSLVSEIYSIQDYLFWDSGLADHRTDWDNNSGTVSESYSDNGTTISTADASTTKGYTANYVMTDECIVEFDCIKNQTGNIRFGCKGSDLYLSNSRLETGVLAHIKMVLSNGKVNWYIGNVWIEEKSTTSSSTFLFRTFGTGLTFRNFKIYKY